MNALLVIDMQAGCFRGDAPHYDVEAMVSRINQLAAKARQGGLVVFLQHCDDGEFRPGSAGWQFLPALEIRETDLVIQKTASDGFVDTPLLATLQANKVRKLFIAGCSTDVCVDSTLRGAASAGFNICAVADAHTTRNRPHLDARSIIAHHNWMWENIVVPHRHVEALPTEQALRELGAA